MSSDSLANPVLQAGKRTSGLEWRIVRPSVLTDPRNFHGGKVSRIDVARFVVAEVEHMDWRGQAPILSQ